MAASVLIVHQLEKKKKSESDSNNIIPLWRYCYSCGVWTSIFIEISFLWYERSHFWSSDRHHAALLSPLISIINLNFMEKRFFFTQITS